MLGISTAFFANAVDDERMRTASPRRINRPTVVTLDDQHQRQRQRVRSSLLLIDRSDRR